jgi:DNA-binding MarR family transcriptional regulator
MVENARLGCMTELQATARLLKRAQYRNHRAMDRALMTVGTSLAQWDALRAISETPGSSSHDLALATFQSDQAFGTLANRLETQGLIERTAGKGRRMEHRLTAAGKKMLAAGQAVAAKVAVRSFASLSKAEIAKLHELLLRVGEVVE